MVLGCARSTQVTLWQPTRIEKIYRESERASEEVDEGRWRGITPIFVPDDDKDHIGSVYDKEDEDELLPKTS